ncbi:lipoyl(octanoyl) transferase LipB [uncultured Sphingomonas sp.]|uniref:lipoyl(octanoyl) transferase LipB n=1 Tax=uncultured Sphingomonas sp. TaxID=158754 RepID=UPI0035C96530
MPDVTGPVSAPDIEWRVTPGLTSYADAVTAMEARAAAVASGEARELVWLLEHPPVYTGGTSAVDAELIDPRFPVIRTGRGGRYTYHGPGQRIGYLMLDLNKRGRDVRRFVGALEEWLIAALARAGVAAFTVPGRVGIWTVIDGEHAKVAAIGVRVRRWVTLHGFSVNISPDLSHFGGIVPCGIDDAGVTSMRRLGLTTSLESFDLDLQLTFPAFLATLSCSAQMEA